MPLLVVTRALRRVFHSPIDVLSYNNVHVFGFSIIVVHYISTKAGVWGQEETGGGFPFHRGMPFELHMKVTQHGYKVSIVN